MRILIFCFFIFFSSSCSQKSDKITEIDAFISARSRYKLNAYLRYHEYFFGLNEESTFNQQFSVSGVHATYDTRQKKLNSISVEYYPNANSGVSQYDIIEFDDSGTIIKILILNDELTPQRQAFYYFSGGKLLHSEKHGIEVENLNTYLHGIDSIHKRVKTTLINKGLILSK